MSKVKEQRYRRVIGNMKLDTLQRELKLIKQDINLFGADDWYIIQKMIVEEAITRLK